MPLHNPVSRFAPLLLATLTIAACGESSDSVRGTGSTASSESYRQLSEPFFTVDRAIEVEIRIPDEHWDALRYDAPGLEHFSAPTCPSGPRPRSFEWHTSQVHIDGELFDAVEVRKKGLKGSMSTNRPSLKLKFQRDNKPGGMRRMTLNNAIQDQSYAKECLAYHLFRAAGLPAPRCGLAQVSVNGQFIGVYTHIEEIRRPLLSMYFENGEGPLWELTMADFVEPHRLQIEAKRDDEIYDPTYIPAVTEALTLPDEPLLAALESYFDLDAFFTYWAMEVISSHWDGYAGNRNNSYVYQHPADGLLHFIPWGTDAALSTPADFFGQFRDGVDPVMPRAVYAHGRLARRLYGIPGTRARYERRLRELLADVWDQAELLRLLERISATTSTLLTGDSLRNSRRKAQEVRGFIEQQASRILSELDAGLTEWKRLENPPLCVYTEQELRGTLTTEWGSQAQSSFEFGEGEGTETVDGETHMLAMLHGTVGIAADQHGYPQVVVTLTMGPLSHGRGVRLVVRIPDELVYSGSVVALDHGLGSADAAWVNLRNGAMRPAGVVTTGSITLEHVDRRPGGRIVVSFEAPLGVFDLS